MSLKLRHVGRVGLESGERNSTFRFNEVPPGEDQLFQYIPILAQDLYDDCRTYLAWVACGAFRESQNTREVLVERAAGDMTEFLRPYCGKGRDLCGGILPREGQKVSSASQSPWQLLCEAKLYGIFSMMGRDWGEFSQVRDSLADSWVDTALEDLFEVMCNGRDLPASLSDHRILQTGSCSLDNGDSPFER